LASRTPSAWSSTKSGDQYTSVSAKYKFPDGTVTIHTLNEVGQRLARVAAKHLREQKPHTYKLVAYGDNATTKAIRDAQFGAAAGGAIDQSTQVIIKDGRQAQEWTVLASGEWTQKSRDNGGLLSFEITKQGHGKPNNKKKGKPAQGGGKKKARK